ncbi:MAG: hypothetical protein KGH92_08030 [Xanthomonadaceae bacterium]|nr:hypothetical protein [Xanthomonadaceae bacterium]
MQIKLLGASLRSRLLSRAAAVVALAAGTIMLPSSGISSPTGGYVLNWHTIVSGGVVHSANPCYRLSGSIAQVAITPGVTTATGYTLFSGFWTAAPIAGQDEIFFNGFEDCKP